MLSYERSQIINKQFSVKNYNKITQLIIDILDERINILISY